MKKVLIKVSEATTDQLEWLVASLVYPKDTPVKKPEYYVSGDYPFTSEPRAMRPLITKEQIRLDSDDNGYYWAEMRTYADGSKAYSTSYDRVISQRAPDPLVAAARCYVVAKIGETAYVPDCI